MKRLGIKTESRTNHSYGERRNKISISLSEIIINSLLCPTQGKRRTGQRFDHLTSWNPKTKKPLQSSRFPYLALNSREMRKLLKNQWHMPYLISEVLSFFPRKVEFEAQWTKSQTRTMLKAYAYQAFNSHW